MKRVEVNHQKAAGLFTAIAELNLIDFFNRLPVRANFFKIFASCLFLIFSCSCTKCDTCDICDTCDTFENEEEQTPPPSGGGGNGGGGGGGGAITSNEAADMFLPHEALPHGVPDGYGWKKKPVIEYGAKMPANFKKIIQWGQVYAEQSLPNPDKDFPNIRVHLRNMKIYIYQKDNTWKVLESNAGIGGAHYVENFSGDVNKPAVIHNEPGGGISAQAGSGFNFHFWGSMQNVDPNNLKGCFVVCEARLIGVQGNQNPKYILNVGADYWRDAGLPHSSVWTVPAGAPYNIAGLGMGRFKYVTTEWQYFSFHTFSESEMKSIKLPSFN